MIEIEKKRERERERNEERLLMTVELINVEKRQTATTSLSFGMHKHGSRARQPPIVSTLD